MKHQNIVTRDLKMNPLYFQNTTVNEASNNSDENPGTMDLKKNVSYFQYTVLSNEASENSDEELKPVPCTYATNNDASKHGDKRPEDEPHIFSTYYSQ